MKIKREVLVNALGAAAAFQEQAIAGMQRRGCFEFADEMQKVVQEWDRIRRGLEENQATILELE